MPIGTGKKPENTVPMAREYPSHISVLLVVYGIDVRIPNRLILKFSGRNFSNYGMINQVCVVIPFLPSPKDQFHRTQQKVSAIDRAQKNWNLSTSRLKSIKYIINHPPLIIFHIIIVF